MNQRDVMAILKAYHHKLSRQQFKTIKGQIIAGDPDGAYKGLRRIINGTSR